eukprot:5796999-Pleurochrysis_carterae.AAC.1
MPRVKYGAIGQWPSPTLTSRAMWLKRSPALSYTSQWRLPHVSQLPCSLPITPRPSRRPMPAIFSPPFSRIGCALTKPRATAGTPFASA